MSPGNGNNLRRPPPLPPRQASSASMPSDAPPPYELIAHQQRALEKVTASASDSQESGAASVSGLERNDPRSSSQQSLSPAPGEQSDRRRLLLVYVHGFMGNESSFRSFPAHVHHLLAVLLAETHVVHTKVYPRYRSRNHITVARDAFSKWLEPHERSSTDVILLGHSMGGLLAAEVASMPSPTPNSGPLKHRILGTINFDVPFLGMHPGVVKSGLSSIFKPSEETHEARWGDHDEQATGDVTQTQSKDGLSAPPSRKDTLFAPAKQDPNFNPAFTNDVVLPVRQGWRNAWHFLSKHSDDLYKSTKKLVSSHLEFGGAMANYGELKARYAKLRALEEPDTRVRQSVVEGGVPPRVRFVNYYTASTGRPKKPASPSRQQSPSPHRSRPSSRASYSRQSLVSSLPGSSGATRDQNGTARPKSNAEEDTRAGVEDIGDKQWSDAIESPEIGESPKNAKDGTARPASISSTELTAIPESPSPPPPLGDLSYVQDKDIRKLVEKEHEKAAKAYEKAVKERKRILERHARSEDKQKRKEEKVADRVKKAKQPLEQKPESEMSHSEKEELRLHKEKLRMEAEGRRLRGEPEPEAAIEPKDEVHESASQTTPLSGDLPEPQHRAPSFVPSTAPSTTTQDSSLLSPQRTRETVMTPPKKDRKFCVLPPKDSHSERDPCWVRVFMKNVDEVGAHCGLFFVDERYERLVGDVAERVELWVREAPT